MAYQAYPIPGFVTGYDTEVEPWILQKDAFQNIVNGFVHHGVLEKRSGTQFLEWMVHADITVVDTITRSNPGVVTLISAAGVANGDYFQIRGATGMTEVNNVTYQVGNLVGNEFDILDLDGNNVDTTSFGMYGASSGDYYPIPRLPIMGIKTFIDTNNVYQVLIFDTKRGAIFDSGTSIFNPLDTADIFGGTASSFISCAAFGKTEFFGTSTFYFTNFNGDVSLPISPMRQFTTGSTTSEFIPDVTPTTTSTYVIAAQFIFAIKNRLLLLNTVESDTLPSGTPPTGTGTNFAQRMRWSAANNPDDSGSNWDQITPGYGGFSDAATSEQIISAKQLQDIILVFFTSSVWAVEPTADPALPFRWVKLNSYRACDAPYATIGHDRYNLSYGKRGIFACDRVEVQRVDQKLELFMMNEVNNEYIERMYSERNYTTRRSWTLYPSSTDNLNPANEAETSNFALIRTEEEGAWSFFDVAMRDRDPENGTNLSCLGFAELSQDLAFQDFTGSLDLSYEDFGNETWSSYYTEAETETFLGGDQIGRVLILEKGGDDLGEPIGFEMMSAAWNPYKLEGKQAQLGYVDIYVEADEDTNFTVEFFSDDITTSYASQTMNCLPNLGFIADIQAINLTNPVSIEAYSHGLSTGAEVFIYNVSGTDEVTGGPYTITKVSENEFTLDGIDGTGFSPYLGYGQVVKRRFENNRCWKRAYAGGKGYQHYIRISNNGTDDVLRIIGIIPWFRTAGTRIIG